MTTGLFKFEPFKSHSGLDLPYKIECDAFSDEEIAGLAGLAVRILRPFSHVIGIPTGGTRLAHAMMEHASDLDHGRRKQVLIVDDVLTTGNSMQVAYDKEVGRPIQHWGGRGRVHEPIGLAIFARVDPPVWVTPLFRVNSWIDAPDRRAWAPLEIVDA